MDRILFVAPHPDDETLGCGGTILKLAKARKSLHWLIMTNVTEDLGFTAARVASRQKEIESVAAEYGFETHHKLDFPTTRLDTVPKKDLIDSAGAVISAIRPDTVFLPFRQDAHSDHKATFDAVMSSIKVFRTPCVRRVYMYEVVSETEFAPPLANQSFVPTSFSDITDFLDRKISIMKRYAGELAPQPFPRSVENILSLATFRGAAAGVRHAEAFVMLKEIW